MILDIYISILYTLVIGFLYHNYFFCGYKKIFNLFIIGVFVLTEIGVGEIIYDLRKKIQEAQSELSQLGDPASEIPELITSANLLRSNEYLIKANQSKTNLISAYSEYASALEELLSSVFEIQHDLKEVLKEQSQLISTKPKKQQVKKAKKTSKTKLKKTRR